jgi:hypothetical protein
MLSEIPLQADSSSIQMNPLYPRSNSRNREEKTADNLPPAEQLPSVVTDSMIEDEITEGIVNLSEKSKNRIISELEPLKASCIGHRTPNELYRLLLFRKYANIANDIKDELHGRPGEHRIPLIGRIPSYVYESNEDQLTGWTAMTTNAFRLRFITAIFSFISFTIMVSESAVVKYADYQPSIAFLVIYQYFIEISSH